jgi:hypothetical protein
MQIIFISPDCQKAAAFTGDYQKASDSFRDFMKYKAIEGTDFLLGNYGNWEVYSKLGIHLEFCGTIGSILAPPYRCK